MTMVHQPDEYHLVDGKQQRKRPVFESSCGRRRYSSAAIVASLIIALVLLTGHNKVDAFGVLDIHRDELSQRVVMKDRPLFGQFPRNGALWMAGSDKEDENLVTSIADSATVWTLDDEPVLLAEILQKGNSDVVILSCLSHFGDFNAWELTQQYLTAMKEGGKFSNFRKLRVVLVGIGSVASAQSFANDLDLDKLAEKDPDQRLTLVADPTGAIAESLGCYRGWLTVDRAHRERYPQTDISPLLKLLGMIFSFGSPGTIQKVLYGYIGDTSGSKGVDGRTWVVESLLQGSTKGRFPKLTDEAFQQTPINSSLRPFELATLRLQTGLHIVQNWGRLGPEEGDLVTRMGGTFVLDSDLKCQWSYFDQGILTYADIDEVYEVVQAISKGETYLPWSKEQKTAFNNEREALLAQRSRISIGSDPLPSVLTDPIPTTGDTVKEEPGTQVKKTLMDEEDVGAGNLEKETLMGEEDAEVDVLEYKQKEDDSSISELAVDGESVDEALLGDLVEEAAENIVGAFDDDLEDASNENVSFVAEEDEDARNGLISSQPATSAKEQFQRSLLQTQIQYSVRSDRGKAQTPSNIRVTSRKKDERELSQRSLLDARYQYETTMASSDSSTKAKSPSFAEELSMVNGASLPQDEKGSSTTDEKELFQRALLRARMQNKKP